MGRNLRWVGGSLGRRGGPAQLLRGWGAGWRVYCWGRTQQWGAVRLGSIPVSAALMGAESGPLGPWECVGGGPGVGPGGRHSRDTQGAKGPATTTFLSSRGKL